VLEGGREGGREGGSGRSGRWQRPGLWCQRVVVVAAVMLCPGCHCLTRGSLSLVGMNGAVCVDTVVRYEYLWADGTTIKKPIKVWEQIRLNARHSLERRAG
jgi:hypothetical protein